MQTILKYFSKDLSRFFLTMQSFLFNMNRFRPDVEGFVPYEGEGSVEKHYFSLHYPFIYNSPYLQS